MMKVSEASVRHPGRVLRVRMAAVLLGCLLLPVPGDAQTGQGPGGRETESPWRVGVGVGWSYYSLASRADAGTVISATGSYTAWPILRVEASVRTLRCADCFTFVMAEGGLQVRLPLGDWAPFVAGGLGVTSDPEFVGTRAHLFTGVGAALEPGARPVGLELEIRGRQLDAGNRMVEVSLGVTLRRRGSADRSTVTRYP